MALKQINFHLTREVAATASDITYRLMIFDETKWMFEGLPNDVKFFRVIVPKQVEVPFALDEKLPHVYIAQHFDGPPQNAPNFISYFVAEVLPQMKDPSGHYFAYYHASIMRVLQKRANLKKTEHQIRRSVVKYAWTRHFGRIRVYKLPGMKEAADILFRLQCTLRQIIGALETSSGAFKAGLYNIAQKHASKLQIVTVVDPADVEETIHHLVNNLKRVRNEFVISERFINPVYLGATHSNPLIQLEDTDANASRYQTKISMVLRRGKQDGRMFRDKNGLLQTFLHELSHGVEEPFQWLRTWGLDAHSPNFWATFESLVYIADSIGYISHDLARELGVDIITNGDRLKWLNVEDVHFYTHVPMHVSYENSPSPAFTLRYSIISYPPTSERIFNQVYETSGAATAKALDYVRYKQYAMTQAEQAVFDALVVAPVRVQISPDLKKLVPITKHGIDRSTGRDYRTRRAIDDMTREFKEKLNLSASTSPSAAAEPDSSSSSESSPPRRRKRDEVDEDDYF